MGVVELGWRVKVCNCREDKTDEPTWKVARKGEEVNRIRSCVGRGDGRWLGIKAWLNWREEAKRTGLKGSCYGRVGGGKGSREKKMRWMIEVKGE